MSSAPFPYNGRVPGTGEAFLNASTEGRLAHRTRGGRLYTADETYSDNRSLFHIPKGFDITQPGVIVLFFHGHGAMLKRDVWERQRLPAQITASGVNAVLLAPQFAVDARDSSIGRFWQPGALRQYLNDAARQFAALYGEPGTEAEFARMPIVVVGYSGGYMPAAWGLAHGGVRDRVSGVLLLDAMYGHQASFFNFIRRSPSAFFVSSYGRYTRNGNDSLRRVLADVGIDAAPSLPSVLRGGSVALIEATVSHRDYVTNAWAPMPVADVLRRMPGVGRIAAPGRVASRR